MGLTGSKDFRGAAGYVGRILKGDLPVQASDKFELVINLKTVGHLALPSQCRCSAEPTT